MPSYDSTCCLLQATQGGERVSRIKLGSKWNLQKSQRTDMMHALLKDSFQRLAFSFSISQEFNSVDNFNSSHLEGWQEESVGPIMHGMVCWIIKNKPTSNRTMFFFPEREKDRTERVQGMDGPFLERRMHRRCNF